MAYHHITAMLLKSVALLNCKPGKTIVDGTLGGFGHANLICDKISPGGTLIGIDQDIDAIQNAKKLTRNSALKLHIIHDNFVNLPKILDKIGVQFVDGILIDIGLSLHHIQASGRGFSFLRDEPLDMRMNKQIKTTAAMILASIDENKLAKILRKYGEERWSNRIARYLVKARASSPIKTSGQLSYLVQQAIPKGYTKSQKIHPATRVFMALRIAVNQELEVLEQFLKEAIKVLKTYGRLCVLSFNSLEDRIVKKTFKTFQQPCTCPPDFPICTCKLSPIAHLITKKVLRPTKEEIEKNPMARSTRLRVIEKI